MVQAITLEQVTVAEGTTQNNKSGEIICVSGMKGPMGAWIIRQPGKAIVKNKSANTVYYYSVVQTGPLGDWTSAETKLVLYPGEKRSHEASWDGQHDTRVFNFSTKVMTSDEINKDKKDKGDTIPPDPPWHDAQSWVEKNWVMLVLGAVGLGVLVWLMFYGGIEKVKA